MVVSIFAMVGVLDAKYISGLGANCTSRLLFLLFITKYFVFVKCFIADVWIWSIESIIA